MSESPDHAADRLLAAIARRSSPVCVGIDPVVERLPSDLQPHGRTPAAHANAILRFCSELLSEVSPHVPCVKFQSACFERYRHHGVQILFELIQEARALGLEVILDAKRGDIGMTAEHYAAAAFDRDAAGHQMADWLTVNSYLGADGIRPFLCSGHGAFALVRTSNPGGDALQSAALADGSTVADLVARMISTIGKESIGDTGYSSLGAVVGATRPDDAARLRSAMPHQIFLVPGYGAQGGTLEDVLPCFQPDDTGRQTGAIVAASRSVIYAFEGAQSGPWTKAVGDAAAAFADDVAAATGWR